MGKVRRGGIRIIPSCPAACKAFFAEAGLPSDARYVSLGASKLRRYPDDVSQARIENQRYRTTGWLTLVGSIPSTDASQFSDDTEHYSGRVTNEIRPQKPETQRQPAQCGLADRGDPRCVGELADLHQDCASSRDRSPYQDRTTSQQCANQQEQHQRPQCVAGVLSQERR